MMHEANLSQSVNGHGQPSMVTLTLHNGVLSRQNSSINQSTNQLTNLLFNYYLLLSVEDPGFLKGGGTQPCRGTKVQRSDFAENWYVTMKELAGLMPRCPSWDLPMIVMLLYIMA